MLASILNTPISVQASVQVVRAFVRLREMLVTNKALADKLAELERKVASHDEHIQSLFEAIRQFMEPPEKGDGPSGSMSRRPACADTQTGAASVPVCVQRTGRSDAAPAPRAYSNFPLPWRERVRVRGKR